MNSSEVISEVLEFQASAQRSRSVRSISYCILTLILLEIVFTYNKERTYIWRRPWSLFKILFILCRYLSVMPALIIIFPPVPSDAYCAFEDWYIGLVNTILTLLPSSCLLAIRLDRLYASKTMRRTLITLVLVDNALQLAVAVSVLPKFSPIANLIPRNSNGVGGDCFVNLPRGLWFSKSLIMVPYLVLICIYIVIAWHAFIRHCREKSSLSSMGAVRKNFAPFYILFVRDGVVCYIINFLGVLCGFLILTVPSGVNAWALVGPVVITGVTSISCCRLALLLHGDPGHATGVYQLNTNEVRVEIVFETDDSTSSIVDLCEN